MSNKIVLALFASLTACQGGAPAPAQQRAALSFTAEKTGPCAEPAETTAAPPEESVIPTPPPALRDAFIDGGARLDLARPAPRDRAGTVQVLVALGDGSVRDLRMANVDLRVQAAPVTERVQGGRVVLGTKGKPLHAADLLVTYVLGQERGRPAIGIRSLTVLDRASGAPLDQHDPGLGLTDTPGSCPERALVQYGPLPWDMPRLKFPPINDCAEGRCEAVALSWIRLHHDVWRTEQMFTLLDSMPTATRSWAWGRPGTNELGDSVGERSSPAYWLGAYDAERYAAMAEVIHKYGALTRSAAIGETELRLQCPVYGDNPGNVCFSDSDVLGHHWVRGFVNFCDSAFNRVFCDSPDGDTVDEVMHHEPLHHVFTHFNGLRQLRDTFTHIHGKACLSDIDTSATYCEDEVRHFVQQGETCQHVDKLPRVVDAYAKLTLAVGSMVRRGTMAYWPKAAEATPKAPTCVGGAGCLCETTQFDDLPDGDYAIDRHCSDNDGLAVCVATKFDAGDRVGICRLCDEHRGPGCPCNDVTQPCAEGSCFGDDTGGSASATGTCYVTPPSFACLADCEELLGDNAFCLPTHPGHGRCVPPGTTLPEATNCWESGGHMDPQTLSCTDEAECGAATSCQDLGYPPYFVCDKTLRCVPAI